MIEEIYKLGVQRYLDKIAAATVTLPQSPKLFGTMKPAQNLSPTKNALNKIKPTSIGGTNSNNFGMNAIKPLGVGTQTK